jgi:hypothetical protein
MQNLPSCIGLIVHRHYAIGSGRGQVEIPPRRMAGQIPNPKSQKGSDKRIQEPESGKTATTVSGYWFLVTDNVFAPDLPDYPEYQKNQSNQVQKNISEEILDSEFCILDSSPIGYNSP